jgi:hypothetical protein
MPAVFAMIFVFYPNAFKIASGLSSKIKFTAAHEKITFRAWTDILTLLVYQFSVTDRTEIPPVVFLFRF